MNKSLTALLSTLAAGLLLSTAVHAEPEDRRAAAKERFASMTPEERAAAKEKMRKRWDSMTPEQQAAAKQRFKERHPDGGRRMLDRKQDGEAAR